MTDNNDRMQGAKLFDQTALLRRRLAAAEKRAADAESVARHTRAKLAKAVLEAARVHDTNNPTHGHPKPEEHAAMQALMSELADAKVALAKIENDDYAARTDTENELKTAHTRDLAELAQEHEAALATQSKLHENRLAGAIDNELRAARAAWEIEHEAAIEAQNKRNQDQLADEIGKELRKAREDWEAEHAEQLREVEDQAAEAMRRREREWRDERDLIMQEVSEQLRSRTAPQKAAKSRTPKKKSAKRSSASRASRAFLWAAFLVAFLTLGNEFFPNAKPAVLQYADPWINRAVAYLSLANKPRDASPNAAATSAQADDSSAPGAGSRSNHEAALQQRIREAKAAIEATARRERKSLEQDLAKIRSALEAAEARAAGAEAALADAKATHAKETARLRGQFSKSATERQSAINDLQQQVRTLRAQLTAGKSAQSRSAEPAEPVPGVRSAE